jgi:hypothetical protein
MRDEVGILEGMAGLTTEVPRAECSDPPTIIVCCASTTGSNTRASDGDTVLTPYSTGLEPSATVNRTWIRPPANVYG